MTDIRWTFDSDGVFEVEVVKTENTLAYCRDRQGNEIGVFTNELFATQREALDAHNEEWPEGWDVEGDYDGEYDESYDEE